MPEKTQKIEKRDSFSSFHPAVNFTFFTAVIVCGMCFLHPVFLLIGLSAAFAYSLFLNGKRALKFNLGFLLPMMLLVSLVNPLFNHRGVTILFYLHDNPITMESLVYGGVTALMFGTVILWFSCYNAVMTSDKFICLFGRVIPAMSLIFSMVLRFVPKFKDQIRRISQAQRCIGRDVGDGKKLDRAKHGLRIVSIMTTWALENAVTTADSMRSRGYGLPGRTAYSNFRLEGRDILLLAFLAAAATVTCVGAVTGLTAVQYFPQILFAGNSPFSLIVFIMYGIMCYLPLAAEIREGLLWKRLESQI